MNSKSNNVLVEEENMDSSGSRFKIDLLVPLLLLVISIILGALAPSLVTVSIMKREVPFPPHAILWIGFSIIAISSAFWLWDMLIRKSKESATEKSESESSASWWRVLVVFVIMMMGYISIKYIGLLIAAGVVHGVLLRYLGKKSYLYIIFTSLLYSVIVYVIFEVLFSVRLPKSTILPFLPF